MSPHDGPGTTRVEIRVHGRGGQGTVTLAALITDAAFRDGWHVLGFPSFGTERTGAPVAAFVRLDRQPIFDRGEVRTPDIVAVQDPTIGATVDVTEGLTPLGLVLINAQSVPGYLRHLRTIAVPLTDLAIAQLGSPRTSAAMLGALAAAADIFTLDAACAAIGSRFRGEIAARNIALARVAFGLVYDQMVAA